jgi:hypothetical protein
MGFQPRAEVSDTYILGQLTPCGLSNKIMGYNNPSDSREVYTIEWGDLKVVAASIFTLLALYMLLNKLYKD